MINKPVYVGLVSISTLLMIGWRLIISTSLTLIKKHSLPLLLKYINGICSDMLGMLITIYTHPTRSASPKHCKW